VTFFNPAVDAAVEIIRTRVRNAKQTPITAVYMVGGFSASPYMTAEINRRLEEQDIEVSVNTPDGQTAKAVAEGAVAFYIGHFVKSRVAKSTYGVLVSRAYEPNNPLHAQMAYNTFITPSGRKMLRGGFGTILARGTTVREDKEYRRELSQEITSTGTVEASCVVYQYQGTEDSPKWFDLVHDKDMFSILCKIEATIPKLPRGYRVGDSFNFFIAMKFGGTEMRAQICWLDNNEEKRGNATIIYNGDDEDDSSTSDDVSEHHGARLQAKTSRRVSAAFSRSWSKLLNHD